MDVDTARVLAEQYLSGELPMRWRHVRQVAARAADLAVRLGLPAEPVVAAAWLHDIGYATALVDCGFHPIDGARYLRDHGWPADVYNLVAHHSCARVEAGHRGLGQILADDFTDQPGLSRDVLWAADATTGPDGTPLTLDQRVQEIVTRYGEGSLVADCILAIKPELAAAIARTEAAIARRSAEVGPAVLS